jgi:sulfite reductase (NADPH) flavoprotein alpha-component
MLRRIHSVFGLIALIVVLSLATSGAILSVYPVTGSLLSAPVGSDRTVADIAGPLAAAQPGMQSIEVRPSGQIIANYSDESGTPHSGVVNPATGQISGPSETGGGFYGWLKDFHRAFLLGDTGRIAAGLGAAALTALSLSGLMLMVTRMGGWARLFDRPKGGLAARLHTVMTRMVLLPFLLSSLTAIYMTLAQFDLITVDTAASVAYPESTQGLPAISPGKLPGLAAVPLSDLRSLQFPMSGDALDVFTMRTTRGLTVVDQFNGEVLETVAATRSEQVYAWIYALHTGEGLAWLGALLGLAAAMVPAISVAGVIIWWQRRQSGQTRVAGNVPANKAQVVVLVGSEGGSTWGFARALHRNLTSAGKLVHLTEINDFSGHYPMAEQVLFLTATYGDGHAPESASKALKVLDRQVYMPKWRYAVLGFGDRAFPKFCQFAKDLDSAMSDRGWPALLPTTLINRQSTQAFASWGNDLGPAMGLRLALTHQIATPPTQKLMLTGREVFGRDVQAPTAILQFRVSSPLRQRGWRRWLRRLSVGSTFAPTDLLGVIAPGDAVPRYYSVASTASDTEVEICVRKQIGGHCSTFLHDLEIGQEIDAFAIANPDFALPSQRKPVIMVSAGTGIAPFAGLIRSNHRKQPLHLFWGGRAPTSDFLYGKTMQDALKTHHLATLTTAFSRVGDGAYVQDRLRADTTRLAGLLKKGAAIMVCGGDGMAHAAHVEFEAILQTIGSSVKALKQRGLYLEDVF